MATKKEECSKARTCPYCDAEIAEAALPYCEACSLKVLRCPKCGLSVPRAKEKCPRCGADIKREAAKGR